MFEPTGKARVYGLAPGVDFPQALVDGLRDRLSGGEPEDIARIDLIVNTRRMQRRLRKIFDSGPAGFLPRIRLITDLDHLVPGLTLAPAQPPLRRRLELIAPVARLLDTQKNLAARSSLYDLTDSLVTLMDEMQGEGVTADKIASLDVSDQSGHWQRAQSFIGIVQDYIDRTGKPLTSEGRQRLLVQRLVQRWSESPPQHSVIVAGSTGSRGTTMLLMEAVARLPQGALVLPGFDFAMPASVWSQLGGEVLAEDHPQFRFRRLMQALDLQRGDISSWHDRPPPSPERNALVSLSLRPAPFTHAWLTEGRHLGHIEDATSGMTLLEAPSPRIEALAIALRLRQAMEDGQTAALITPDRMLTRQVTAALDRWDIVPDDSAGMPLHLSPPGRFLRHVAGLFVRRLDAETLLTLLKHPLTHSGDGRGRHQLNVQRLDLRIRSRGLPYPDAEGIARLLQGVVAGADDQKAVDDWAVWVGRHLTGRHVTSDRPLHEWVADHLKLAETLSAGEGVGSEGDIWRRTAGQKAHEVMQELAAEAHHGGEMSAGEYADLIGALLSGAEVRDRDAPHSGTMIWGTLEARVQGADLVILGGLNDGIWPEAPPPDPWLNRILRFKAGLLLPDRRIGLSAHDYQQAVAAPQVWLTRSIRSEDSETIASRWINRLGNLMEGLPAQGGPEAWAAMTRRGATWLARAAQFECVERVAPSPRPSPMPPVSARPHSLSVTEIKHLIRDPYAIYGRHILRLRKLGPLVQAPDALIRGTLAHEIMERFVKDLVNDSCLLSESHLLAIARTVLDDSAPWPAARAMWLARIERIAAEFVSQERIRQAIAQPVAFEGNATGTLIWSDIGFSLKARADRIDRTPRGDILVYDYKTGRPPTKAEQRSFDKQLLIEAGMIEAGAFPAIGPSSVDQAVFLGLGNPPVAVAAPLEAEPPADVLSGLHRLVQAYLTLEQGFTARRMVQMVAFEGDYDQLARFGEWDETDAPVPEVLR